MFEFIDQPDLKTKRLHLRRPVMADADNVARCLNDFDIAKMLVRVPWPYTPEGANWWISQWLEGRQNGWCFALAERDNPEFLIGVVSIEPMNKSHGIGWWLDHNLWSMGYMSEALQDIILHAQATHPQAILTAGAIVDNPVSLHIQKKLGFAVIGQEKAHCLSRNMPVDLIKTQLVLTKVK
jgi:8-oxo-dGTP diphosphatase